VLQGFWRRFEALLQKRRGLKPAHARDILAAACASAPDAVDRSAGWFEQWADATFASDPVGAAQTPPKPYVFAFHDFASRLRDARQARRQVEAAKDFSIRCR
jgi:hypothetical protein